jgi:predicted GH43/DUF377 family glycosyl hydrolase
MSYDLSRRALLAGGAVALGGAALPVSARRAADPVAPFRTPYKLNRHVLLGSHVPGSFDEKAVDCPFVFFHDGRFYLTYVGFDGIGYQTGIAVSDDLVNWERQGVILARDPSDPVTRYNVAAASILRENELYSPGRLIKIDGRYVCAWHAYPGAGYEEGPAVIGLAFSTDLKTWHREAPILRPEDGAEWERGGLYKPYLVKHGDTFYLFYNAKTADKQWHEQTGVAISKDLKTWRRYPGNPIIRNGPAGAPDSRFASDPFVVSHRGKWALYYFGLSASDNKARDLVAIGNDPLHYTKANEVLIDIGPPGSIDDGYAHKPALVYWKGDLYHFYTAVGGPYPNDVRGISVARSRPWR